MGKDDWLGIANRRVLFEKRRAAPFGPQSNAPETGDISGIDKMPPKRKRTKIEEARHYLQGGGVLREDSDDELGVDDLPWEWIYEKGSKRLDGDFDGQTSASKLNVRTIVGARMGGFECRLGDAVLLKATANEAWVAMITGFTEGETEDDDGQMVWSKSATFMWFSSEKEIKNGAKKRDDAVQVSSCGMISVIVTSKDH